MTSGRPIRPQCEASYAAIEVKDPNSVDPQGRFAIECPICHRMLKVRRPKSKSEYSNGRDGQFVCSRIIGTLPRHVQFNRLVSEVSS